MNKYHALEAAEVLKLLGSTEAGLSKREAEGRLLAYGYNELEKGKGVTALSIFLDQFKNGLIVMLVFAGLLSLVLRERVEAAAIFSILLLNTFLGFIQEFRAEKAMEALEKTAAPTANVLREGQELKIPAKDVVPGDILLLEAGDIVPADSRIIDVSYLQIDEASLTGESVPSKKVFEKLPPESSIADQENMAFMGTVVTYGKGKVVVTATGMKTELGGIARSIQSTREVQTPLQSRFAQLAKQIGAVAGFLIITVFVVGILNRALSVGKMVLFALALTVSTIPNSLPVIVTVSLAMGAKRLAKKNMLIKKLPAAESLGAATIICSDKTGTITKNEMTITDIFFDDQVIRVSGSGYEPKGNLYVGHKQISPKKLELLMRIGYLCNNAQLVEKQGRFEVIGDPTEGSLIVLGEKCSLDKAYLHNHFPLIEELPFDSERKRMTVIVRNKIRKRTEAYVKGAPELLLRVCDRVVEKGRVRRLTRSDREKLLRVYNSFAERALRVLAIAYRELPETKRYTVKNVERSLVFVGLVGMIDPPRQEVKHAVAQCQEAGIRVMIITGDHAVTTEAIAREIGLLKGGDLVLTGDDLNRMGDDELEEKIENVRIIARALPIQKSRVVDALKKKGHVVAMTGDGVNDAPALKKADIGIAMGINGTAVAKEVSKAMLVDDNFATIVKAIREGRNIYDKMIKSAKYLLSCNAGEITSVFAAIMMRFPLPLLPLQLLLMNILTDDLPALGLGFESIEEGIMKRPPRDPKEKPISNRIFLSIIVFGLIMGAGTLFMFSRYKDFNLSKAQTVAFTSLVMFQMFAVLSSRSLHPSLKKLNPLSNLWLLGGVLLSVAIQAGVIYWAPLQSIFGTVALSAAEWLSILSISALGFVMMELSKVFINYTPRCQTDI